MNDLATAVLIASTLTIFCIVTWSALGGGAQRGGRQEQASEKERSQGDLKSNEQSRGDANCGCGCNKSTDSKTLVEIRWPQAAVPPSDKSSGSNQSTHTQYNHLSTPSRAGEKSATGCIDIRLLNAIKLISARWAFPISWHGKVTLHLERWN